MHASTALAQLCRARSDDGRTGEAGKKEEWEVQGEQEFQDELEREMRDEQDECEETKR